MMDTQATRALKEPRLVGLPRHRRRLVLYAELLALDLAALLCGFCAVALDFGRLAELPQSWPCLLVLVFYPVLAFNAKAYSLEALERPSKGLVGAAAALLYSTLAVSLVLFLGKASADVSRVGFVSSALLSLLLLVAGRTLFMIHARRSVGGQFVDLLVILDGMAINLPSGVRAVEAREIGVSPDLHDPAMIDRFARLVYGADRIAIACSPERRAAWAMVLKGLNAIGYLLDPALETVGPLGIDCVHGHHAVTVAFGPLKVTDRLRKRALDFALGGAMLVIVAPLLLLVALAIKIDSRGSVFFVQPRLGRNNLPFPMIKFRSMKAVTGDAAGIRSTARDDDRVTRVGRILRATSIDELPQLLNVLLGQMSIVGPRPHALGSRADAKLFWEIDNRYWHRHAAKPGITGLAQVRGFRGATLQSTDLTNRLQADLEYLNNWTIWRDIRIILATFRVLKHRNAF